ncbi:uncharacterized protein Z519_09351 [Cladophialophora bantiana CBS 173.52]|uniref:Uncharacterized protein n=1 Tax=Cladophialophora bantiana (strain ATCC 10958 / CBS 173.52 / CDC B-1940 / NIH 8579) TaxID=1442370 RepID=A0A0D2EIP2_CLAB1|nr:uncharacterized protein Z519_09351 [Cladophialophora bantiana CBS 173.52]KIW89921.1 hypothetical protein Z519_09351 [Cladophialophora bantiana CBS 173.52]
MAKDRSRKHWNGKRHSSATPQKSSTFTQDIIDLTQTDPWTHQARRARSVAPVAPVAPGSSSKPTPLSPGFPIRKSVERGSRLTTTVNVPQDPKSNPAYIFQQLALANNRANTRPSFFGILDPDDGESSGRSDTTERDDTPTPGHMEARDKDKAKKKSSQGKGKDKQPDREKDKKPADTSKAQHHEGETRQREEKKKRKEEKKKKQLSRPVETQAVAAAESRKRKRDNEEARAFKRRVELEANAVKKLRESLPTVRLDRVFGKLEREEGTKPTEMAVLLTTARDTILDLARQQVLQTQRAQKTIQDELLRILKEQRDKLAELEGKANPSAAPALAAHSPEKEVVEVIDGTSCSSSDDSSSDEDSVQKYIGLAKGWQRCMLATNHIIKVAKYRSNSTPELFPSAIAMSMSTAELKRLAHSECWDERYARSAQMSKSTSGSDLSTTSCPFLAGVSSKYEGRRQPQGSYIWGPETA